LVQTVMAEPDFIPVSATPDFIPVGKPHVDFPAPPGTPTIPKPIAPEMQKVRTLTGTPYNPGRLESSIVDLEKGAIGQAADVSAPTIAHRILQRTGAIGTGSRLYPGEASLKQIPGEAVTSMAGAMGGLEGEGGAIEPQPETIPRPSATTVPPRVARPAPSTPEAPGLIKRVAKVQLEHTPGYPYARDMVNAVRGPKAPAAASEAAPEPIPEGIPETNGIRWGTRGEGPLDLRGQRIPEEPPELTTETRTFPGQHSPEVTRPKIAAPEPIAARKGLALPSHGDAILRDMQPYVDRIVREGHGPEIPEEEEDAPGSLNVDEDLAPALKASLRKVQAAKKIARPKATPAVQ
jgi:hypothetical protein